MAFKNTAEKLNVSANRDCPEETFAQFVSKLSDTARAHLIMQLVNWLDTKSAAEMVSGVIGPDHSATLIRAAARIDEMS